MNWFFRTQSVKPGLPTVLLQQYRLAYIHLVDRYCIGIGDLVWIKNKFGH